MKLVFQYIFQYKKMILLNILSVLLIACGEIGIPSLIGKYIIDNPPTSQNFIIIVMSLIILVICAICGNLIINFCSAKTSSLIFEDLSNDLFHKIQTFSIIEMKKIGVPALINRSIFDINQIVNFVSALYRAAIVAPIMLTISLIFICKTYISFTYSICAVIPCLVIVLIFIIKKNYVLSQQKQKILEEINSKIRENLTGIKIIKTLNTSSYEETKFATINSNYTTLIIKLFNSMLSIEPFFYLLLNISIIITTGLGAYVLKKGNGYDLQLGGLYNCINLQYHILFSILNFLLLFMVFPKTLVASRKIESLLKIEPIIKNNPQNIVLSNQIVSLEFKNVTFQYPQTSTPILKNINLRANVSELIAFVGSTGSGKSTLVNLIPRLIDPTKGCVLINNIDIKNYELKSLRKKIGLVSQKNILFQGTIFSNLLFGHEHADEKQMLQKAQMAQSYDFITKSKNQLQESVSEFGANFSGGQKQRLSITKTFLKQPDIYIFDDSFSALDYQTDLAIRQNFDSFKQNAIIIVVAQRLNSILDADKIIVLEHGQIVDMGKHEQLMKRCQTYQNIAFSQKVKEVLA
ncbi:ABC transporter ATP-binding protein [Candidatus Phytoplasma melaleucae]|uniref:ABC transporter ATP-binding protein/permease n=1 Tax=Candidatus Phytoplasma melaleucae TaxID=2982630 RepID=A0ABT9DEQ0_9MOLU|nr:ABC transporter ATP-binding protein ['Melaleuca sp.' phytoplasma]MDO8168066.1 ABC transporter ATP-binding protein/permease ['Melaleuca sp.' phytoplasma]